MTKIIRAKLLFYEQSADHLDAIINYRELSRRLELVYDEFLGTEELKNKKFLDVGCGLGQFSKKAYCRGAKVTSLDIGDKLLARVKQLVPVKTIKGDATLLPLDSNSFDYVLCTEVIEHTLNPEKVIMEIIRVARPGGKIILTTPNRVWLPLFKLLMFLSIRKYNGIENWIYPWQLQNLFTNNKVMIEKEKGFNLFYPGLFKILEGKLRLLDYLMINYAVVGIKLNIK